MENAARIKSSKGKEEAVAAAEEELVPEKETPSFWQCMSSLYGLDVDEDVYPNLPPEYDEKFELEEETRRPPLSSLVPQIIKDWWRAEEEEESEKEEEPEKKLCPPKKLTVHLSDVFHLPDHLLLVPSLCLLLQPHHHLLHLYLHHLLPKTQTVKTLFTIWTLKVRKQNQMIITVMKETWLQKEKKMRRKRKPHPRQRLLWNNHSLRRKNW